MISLSALQTAAFQLCRPVVFSRSECTSLPPLLLTRTSVLTDQGPILITLTISLKACVFVRKSGPTLLRTLPGSSSLEFSRQECWSGLPFPTPGDLPEIKPASHASPTSAGELLTTVPPVVLRALRYNSFKLHNGPMKYVLLMGFPGSERVGQD